MRAGSPFTRLRRRLPGVALGLVLVLGGAGCASVTGPRDEERDQLEQARAQWRSVGMTSYSYVYRRSCFCAPGATEPMTITVVGNAIQSVARVSDGQRQDPALFDTIDGLF